MKRAQDLSLTHVNNYLESYIECLNVKIKNNEMKNFFKVASCILATLFIVISNLSAETLAFKTNPYLQNPATDGMTIMWITNNNCCSWVEYGLSENALTYTAKTSIKGLIQANNTVNKIRLANLTPGTTYYYRVCSREITDLQPYSVTYGDTIHSSVYSFITPELNAASTKVVILNDMQDNPAIFDTLLSKVQTNDYDFVFLNGGVFSYLTDETQVITNMIAPCTKVFASQKPFMMSMGNHETKGIFARSFDKYVQFPESKKKYYSYKSGPVFFIVLDSGEDKEDNDPEYAGLVNFDTYRQEQVQWLEDQLTSAECRASTYKVVLMHIPPFYSGADHGSLHCRELFNPLFNQYGIDLLISGHTLISGIHQPTTEHLYPIVIGGGYSSGTKAILKISATKSNLDIQIINEEGAEIGTYQIPAGS